MSIFEDIKLAWDGRDYVIPSDRVMGAIARIEDVVTLGELQRYSEKQAAPLAKVAMAYGTVLRYAGANVTDDQVYAGIFSGEAPNQQDSIVTSIYTLLAMMLPPEAMRSGSKDEDTPQGNAPTTAARSSRKATRRRSRPGK